MKKLTSMLMMALAVSAQSVRAAEGDTIKVVFSDTSAEVTIPTTASVKSVINGANVTLVSSSTKEEYVYDVYGSTTNGSLTITGDYKLTLCLNDVNIQSGNGAAIDVECGKRIAVELVGTNTLVDAVGGKQKAAFYTTGHPEFSGGGTLNVTGNAKHAISAKEYLLIKKTVGTINVLSAVSDGIHCGKGKVANENNYFKMNGGVVNIMNVGGDCVDSDDYGTIIVKGGSLNLNVSGTEVEGLKADSVLTIEGGTINITVTGQESTGIRSCYESHFNGGNVMIDVQGDGSKGIKGKQQTNKTVNNGGSVYLNGTEIDILVSGGTVYEETDTTKCMGISVDADLVHTAGSVNILACGTDAYTYHVKGTTEVLADSFITNSIPWTYTPYAYQYDMTAYVSLTVDGEAADYSQYAVGAFVGDECRGVAIFTTQEDYTWGEMRIRSNQANEEVVTFKAYDLTTGDEYDCAETVDFVSQSVEGLPSSPFALSITTKQTLLGDLDKDGRITVNDVTILIAYYLDSEFVADGDMDGDGKITVNDVTLLIEVYLSASAE
ncbi:MAG: carbohydrate-binding domain-containing protein [Bacteroidaceae bacterium]|nr:carbohydrate-binding domain-containing protein [Bacteroidaceae bacterium]